MRPARLVVLVVVLALAGCGGDDPPAPAQRGAGCARQPAGATCGVMFVGNSLTFVNDLPATFRKLAASGGRTVLTGMVAHGGATLADHAAAPGTATALRERVWNVVVVQEQSEVPSVPDLRAGMMFPAARTLVADIRAVGAQPLLFLTWRTPRAGPTAG